MKKLDFLSKLDVNETQIEYELVLDSYTIVFWHLFNIWENISPNFKIEINQVINIEFAKIFYEYYKYHHKIFKLTKIEDLEDFWLEDSWRKSPILHKSLNLPAIKNSIAIGIQNIISPIAITLFGDDDVQVKTGQFSKELANYVTSYALVSTLSNKIGKPKRREIKEDFIVRAECILREILKEKLNV
ncbi:MULTISPECIES: hypothetical protein [Nostocales]|uniref:Uncharacterized protein n=3 Tax=Nostocales TaxID=1161 RepID=A0A8S9T0V8_9CYAN|nr:hypothetical protein [Tolypothrix bouteillei]KAF3885736.1 hypothetical protein DA73_0400009880 [Tolypothrix bouteillei VB521301]